MYDLCFITNMYENKDTNMSYYDFYKKNYWRSLYIFGIISSCHGYDHKISIYVMGERRKLAKGRKIRRSHP